MNFEHIALRYDLANTVLSLGLHRRWKRALVEAVLPRPGARIRRLRTEAAGFVLDAGTGTGDLALLAVSGGARVIGVDMSPAMLRMAGRRSDRSGMKIALIRGDLSNLPLADGTVTSVMSAFVLRHLPDLGQAFGELRRVLISGGRIALLEFGRPRRWLRPLYEGYSYGVLPRLGGWLTGDRAAYEFLVRSIRLFPEPTYVARLMQAAGFADVRWRALSGGIAMLYTATAVPVSR